MPRCAVKAVLSPLEGIGVFAVALCVYCIASVCAKGFGVYLTHSPFTLSKCYVITLHKAWEAWAKGG